MKQNHSFFVMCQTRLPHTVRIYESIRRIPGLTVCNLWNSLKRDTVGRLCDAVANRYLCANRNIFEQPLCMSYGETDAACRCLRTKLFVLPILQRIRVIVSGIRNSVEKDIACNMRTLLSPGRAHQLMPVQLILNGKSAGWCAYTVA